MDVDIIFKRGLAYTAATAGVVAVYFGIIALIGEFSHAAWPAGRYGAIFAIVLAAFLLAAVPRLDAGASRSLLLSRSPGLSPHADRIWPHADQ